MIEGLSDNALLVAMDFGQDKLDRPDGVQALVEIMRSNLRESKAMRSLSCTEWVR